MQFTQRKKSIGEGLKDERQLCLLVGDEQDLSLEGADWHQKDVRVILLFRET